MQDPKVVKVEQLREQIQAQVQAQIQAQGLEAEVEALRARRDELKVQMQTLTERRVLTNVQLGSADDAGRAAIQDRMKALDDRIARIDQEMNRIDDAINRALARQGAQGGQAGQGWQGGPVAVPGVPGTEAPGWGAPSSMPPDFFDGSRSMLRDVLVGQAVGFLLLGAVLWAALRRRLAAATTRLSAEDTYRLDQLQRSVDVMAVEIERISEGQRYVSKVLGAGAAGAAEPVGQRRAEPERVG